MIFNYTKSEFSKRFTEEDLDNLSKSLERYIEKYYHYIRISKKERSSFAKIKNIQFVLDDATNYLVNSTILLL